jgi:hypothetical protein
VTPNDIPEFGLGSVPVSVAAKVYGKDPCWIRAGIIAGWLPIGIATRNHELITSVDEMDSNLGRITYTIFPRRLWEQTGYIWPGKDKVKKTFDYSKYQQNVKEVVNEIMAAIWTRKEETG